jgi:hypothetical protein
MFTFSEKLILATRLNHFGNKELIFAPLIKEEG